MRSNGTLSHDVKRAIFSASGFPVPFSMRDKVEAETFVASATSRRLNPSSSRRRRIARPSSAVLIKDLIVFAILGLNHITRWVLDARLCITCATVLGQKAERRKAEE